MQWMGALRCCGSDLYDERVLLRVLLEVRRVASIDPHDPSPVVLRRTLLREVGYRDVNGDHRPYFH